MKTPEELAEEFANKYVTDPGYILSKAGFLAGYQAAQDQLADASKVMPDTCEHILDMGKMVDVNGWISVKDRLPEKKDIGDIFLVWNAYERDVSTVRWQPYGFDDVNDMYISHWMPLPEIPEDKGKAHWQELREFWKARNVTISEWQEEK